MADDDDDDDDFEDLFSFGSDPTNQPTTSAGSNNDFDILSDVSPTTPLSPAGPGSGSGGPPSSAGENTATQTPGPSPGGTAGGDEFDDLFGTPPPSALPATPRTHTSDEKDTMLALDETPGGGGDTAEMASMNDFHVHDEDTRDMLDWLDDDVPAGKETKQPTKKSDSNITMEDDFDFDQMIAESQSGDFNPDGSKQGSSSLKQTRSTEEKPLPEAETPSLDTSKTDGKSSGPEPVTPERVSSNIEDELALDQWEDDDESEEEVEDSQPTTDAENAQENTPAGDKPPPAENKTSSAKINFESLSGAIRSNASTLENVRQLFRKEKGLNNANNGDVGVDESDRAHLWTKVICGKILEDIEDGSLADSYREWEKKTPSTKFEGEEYDAAVDSLLKQVSGADASGADSETIDAEEKRQLLSLSHFHSHRSKGGSKQDSPSSSSMDDIDPLIPPVALAILRAGIPPAAASVVLSQIEPSAMPLLRLSYEERYLATKALHADFYLLACYHLPLLVMHLDRHCPGWYWPRKGNVGHRIADDEKPVGDSNDGVVVNEDEKEGEHKSGENELESQADKEEEVTSAPAVKSKLEANGLVPLSWFVTIFAGECGGSCLDHRYLLPLWDNVLTKGDHSWKYFLAIAVLEKNSDALLMSRGEGLKQVLEKILDFQDASFVEESFVGASEGNVAAPETNGDEMMSEWLLSAKSLIESTPSSVIELLRSADDRAVLGALKVRQTQVDKELQAQLDADEAARKKERDERDMEAEMALNKARLTSYYRTYNPEKMDTIPQILKLFDGRMGVLNEKLKNKYGKGFLPEEDLKDQTRSFFMSVNQSITETRKHVSVAVAERRKKSAKSTPDERRSKIPMVTLEVSTTEVIPMICTTKAHNLATGKKMTPARRTSDTVEALQFYLVDCRPESVAAEQGRFPTAVTLSPEKLQDPDELQKLTDMFESLRGAVHICVMGEGFASFPVLYNHTLSDLEEKLLQDDLARTGDCALFFLKKGFPFVSVLRGGFAAAHAFLSRNGPPMGMSPPEVLVDYDQTVSLFAQLETARQEEYAYKNAPAREKTVKALQKILDNSMTRLTLEEQRINNLANDLAKPETVVKMKQSVSTFLAKPKTVPSIGFGRAPPLFMSKKFAASPTSKEESEKKIESTQGDKKTKSAATTFTEKMNLKMVSLHSDSSSTALSDNDSGVDKKGNGNILDSEFPESGVSSNEGKVESPKDSVGGKISFASFANRIKQVNATEGSEEKEDSNPELIQATTSSDKGNVGGVAGDNPSKVSSAFASLSQRIHQSDSRPPNSEGDKKESAVIKMSFSGFTNRIKLGQRSADQPTIPSDEAAEGNVSEPKKDPIPETSGEKEPETEDSTDKPADGGRFTKFTKSLGGTLAGLRETTVDVKSPREKSYSISEKSEEKEIETDDLTDKPDDGGKFTKFTKSFGGTLAGLRETTADVKASKEKEDLVLEKSEEKETETEDSTEKNTDRGKFTDFTKSFGGTLAGLRETAANDKDSEENEGSNSQKGGDKEAKPVASTDSPTDVGRFTKFTKSFGGLSLLQSKVDSADQKKSAEREEPGPVAKRITELGKSSMGKYLFEDEPKPKTRFQRLDAEESISFDIDDDAGKKSNSDSQEDTFADISLTEIQLADVVEGEKSDVEEGKPDGEENAIAVEN